MKNLLLATLFIITIFNVKGQTLEETKALKTLDTLAVPTNSASIKNETEICNAISIIKKITALNGQYSDQLETYEKNAQHDKISQETLYMKYLLSEISSIYSKGVFYLKKDLTIKIEDKENYENIYNTTISESLDDFEFAIKIINQENIKMSKTKILSVVEGLKDKQYERRATLKFYNEKISSDSNYKRLNESIKKTSKI
jgi:hypothetical protein